MSTNVLKMPIQCARQKNIIFFYVFNMICDFHNAVNHVFKYIKVIYLILYITKSISYFLNLELHFQMHYNCNTIDYI